MVSYIKKLLLFSLTALTPFATSFGMESNNNNNATNEQTNVRDGDLGRDLRFAFEDKVMEMVERGNPKELHNFLKDNPGKSVNFSHHHLHKNPFDRATELSNGPMLLALLHGQSDVKQYRERLLLYF